MKTFILPSLLHLFFFISRIFVVTVGVLHFFYSTSSFTYYSLFNSLAFCNTEKFLILWKNVIKSPVFFRYLWRQIVVVLKGIISYTTHLPFEYGNIQTINNGLSLMHAVANEISFFEIRLLPATVHLWTLKMYCTTRTAKVIMTHIQVLFLNFSSILVSCILSPLLVPMYL